MGRYVLRRLLQAIPVIFFSTFLVFMVIHLIPGDAAAVLAGPNATPEALAAIRKEMGLDQPLLVQYVVWVGHLLQGDLGPFDASGQPIIKLLQARAPATIQLTVAAMTISIMIAIPLGILSATRTCAAASSGSSRPSRACGWRSPTSGLASWPSSSSR